MVCIRTLWGGWGGSVYIHHMLETSSTSPTSPTGHFRRLLSAFLKAALLNFYQTVAKCMINPYFKDISRCLVSLLNRKLLSRYRPVYIPSCTAIQTADQRELRARSADGFDASCWKGWENWVILFHFLYRRSPAASGPGRTKTQAADHSSPLISSLRHWRIGIWFWRRPTPTTANALA